MSWSGVSDAAQFYRLRQDGSHLQREMQRLTSELGTGRVADLGEALGGDFSALSNVARSLRMTVSFTQTIARGALEAEGRQSALARIEAEITGFAPHILGLSSGGTLSDMAVAITDAPDRLDQVVTALNTSIAGKSLFAGDALDQPALISAEDMMVQLRPLAAAATSATDLVAAIEDWFFDAGGGFEAFAWQGGAGEAPPVVLAEGVQEAVTTTALDPAIREVLAGLALAALTAEGSTPQDESIRRDVVAASANRMISGEQALIGLRADIGASQARIEEARTRTEATRTALQVEHTRLTEADPYRTATDLESVQTRLDSLYILTARLSRLTLSDYLR